MQVITRVQAAARTEPLNVKPHSAALPSLYLFSAKNPMPWVRPEHTDVTKTWERARAEQKGGVL